MTLMLCTSSFFIIRLSLRRDAQADNRWSHEPLCAHTLPRIQRSHEPLGAHALLPRIRRRILLASPKAFDACAKARFMSGASPRQPETLYTSLAACCPSVSRQ
ncbi:hypothetical protein NDU88_001809 [Pleurodeles waltl]|uniref:Secreted protein n=1 Tax=Pleurodeles waltl TaxID=8319 RepID=A0AAV7UTT8_PLEWA|nr:hypothetical protein NDU88_001809 [Pleurodeles waltl]